MFGRWRSDLKRFRALEDAIVELAGDISSLRMQVATMRAKTAVSARESRRKALSAEDRLIEEMTDGRLVATAEVGRDGRLKISGPDDDRSSSEEGGDNSGDQTR